MTQPTATVVLDPTDDEDETHLWCCDPDVAFCGVDLSDGFEDVDEAVEADEVCPLCMLIVGEGWPCPVPGCEADYCLEIS